MWSRRSRTIAGCRCGADLDCNDSAVDCTDIDPRADLDPRTDADSDPDGNADGHPNRSSIDVAVCARPEPDHSYR